MGPQFMTAPNPQQVGLAAYTPRLAAVPGAAEPGIVRHGFGRENIPSVSHHDRWFANQHLDAYRRLYENSPHENRHWVYDNRVHRYSKVHRNDCASAGAAVGCTTADYLLSRESGWAPSLVSQDADDAARRTGRLAEACAVCCPSA